MKLRDLFEVDASSQTFDLNRLWYHASDREFTKFNDREIGSRQARGLARSAPGFWFTDNPDLMGFYAHVHYTVKLRLKNPLIISEDQYDDRKSDWTQKAFADGHDSVIFENIIDGDRESTICCVFNRNLIKIVKMVNTYPDED